MDTHEEQPVVTDTVLPEGALGSLVAGLQEALSGDDFQAFTESNIQMLEARVAGLEDGREDLVTRASFRELAEVVGRHDGVVAGLDAEARGARDVLLATVERVEDLKSLIGGLAWAFVALVALTGLLVVAL